MKEKENIIKDKSFLFSIEIVKLCRDLCNEKREFVMSKQLLRSATGTGALVREAEHGESKLDFIHKLSIAQKEINETIYWLDLLYATDYIMESKFKILKNTALEIKRILTSIIKTTKFNLKK